MAKAYASMIVPAIIGVVISYFIVGMTPSLWMAGAFAASIILLFLGNLLKVLIPLGIVFPIAAAIYFFIRFGWLTGLLFVVIAFISVVLSVVVFSQTSG